MEGTNLEQLVSRSFAEPLRERLVEVGPCALRERRVRNLTDEHVLELVRLLAADRRPRLAHDEIADEKPLDAVFDVVDLRREVRESAAHEDASHHRRALQRDALGRRQTIDARRDQRLDRVWYALTRTRALREHADDLLDEERVALRLREHGVDVDRQVELGGERSDELGALLGLQRLEL